VGARLGSRNGVKPEECRVSLRRNVRPAFSGPSVSEGCQSSETAVFVDLHFKVFVSVGSRHTARYFGKVNIASLSRSEAPERQELSTAQMELRPPLKIRHPCVPCPSVVAPQNKTHQSNPALRLRWNFALPTCTPSWRAHLHGTSHIPRLLISQGIDRVETAGTPCRVHAKHKPDRCRKHHRYHAGRDRNHHRPVSAGAD
jgi:hypothetical protein